MSQVKQGLTSVLNVTLPSQLIRQQQQRNGNSLLSTSTAKVQEENKQVGKKAENEGDDSQVEDEEEENVIDEIIVGKGLGNALKVLRDRGILGKTHIRGRNMDKTLETQLESFDKTQGGS